MTNDERAGDLDGIAIIALAGRMPGARNVEDFWTNVRQGTRLIADLSDSDLANAGVDPQAISNPRYVKAAGVLDDVELFDASFFGYSPAEARLIDPQHRAFLECAWEALERAGYLASDGNENRVGVFAGSSSNAYLFRHVLQQASGMDTVDIFQALIGNDKDYLSTRISYKLGLTGPSVTTQTACSTSLVAVHLACQSLLHGECDLALAGGVSIKLPQKAGYLYQEGSFDSPDGHCYVFDARAKGTVVGSGVGVVVLKRLAEAIDDRDYIYAVIRGSAVNNDGASKVGFTAPSVRGQLEAILEALGVAQVNPDSIAYVEAHGTGTRLGDPIELAALTQAFRRTTSRQGFCAIGSVKAAIGHLDAAAGVVGLMKATLALHHGVIPPSPYFQQSNPELNLETSPFFVNTTPLEWPTAHHPRRAAVSSFGIGGTNAHTVLEQAPPTPERADSRSKQLLLLSAKTASALKTTASNLARYLEEHGDLDLADVAFTLHAGRRAFDHRLAFVCSNAREAIEECTRAAGDVAPIERGGTVFMFPGQGTHYVNMTAELYDTEPTFRRHVDYCCDVLRAYGTIDLRSALFASTQDEPSTRDRLTQTQVLQPTLFTIEYSLARLLLEWGITPDAMIGHSLGEYVAACLAGVFSVEDALRLVTARGRLMQALPHGSMLALAVTEDHARELLGDSLSLAAVNSRAGCVVSGPHTAVEELRRRCTAEGVWHQPLNTSHAFHSTQMLAVVDAFTTEVQAVRRSAPRIPWISNVTGTWITEAEAIDPSYWARQIVQTVRFADGVAELTRGAFRFFIEVGPGQVLSNLVRPVASRGRVVLSSVRERARRDSDLRVLLACVAEYWRQGGTVSAGGVYAGQQRRRVRLPTYPFERLRHWIDVAAPAGPPDARNRQLVKRQNIDEWLYSVVWKRSPDPAGKPASRDAASELCVIFEDNTGFGSRLRPRLESAGQRVVSVLAGTSFEKQDGDMYVVDPAHEEHYRRLASELAQTRATRLIVFHCWLLEMLSSRAREDAADRANVIGLFSIISLVQALNTLTPPPRVEILVVSSDIHDVTGIETIQPEKATVLGACRVVPKECLNVSCRNIDIVLPAPLSREEDGVFGRLIDETRMETDDAIVAYRGAYRWTQACARLPIDPNISPLESIRERGVYVITGGLGGVGATLATHFAATRKARLVLTTRSEWTEESGENERARRVREMQALGAEVLVLKADVTNLSDMQRVIDTALARFGAVDGVVHAAGLAGGGITQLKTRAAAEAVLAPKVRGTLIIDRVLENVPCDFVALCSSLTAVLGDFGQVDYCGANAFLDAFALSMRQAPARRVFSVNWDTWQGVGMAVDTQVPSELADWRANDLAQGITPDEGVEVFGRALSSRASQVVASTRDLQARIEMGRPVANAAIREQMASARASRPTHARPQTNIPFVEPQTTVQRTVAAIVAETLGVDRVGLDDNIFDLGMHSLLLLGLAAELRERCHVEVPMQRLIEAPTVTTLSALVEEAIVRTVGAMRDEDVATILSSAQ